MRIALVTGPFLSLPPAPCGAAERLWDDLTREFAARGHEVDIYCRDHEALSQHAPAENVRLHPMMRMNASPSLKMNLMKDLYYAHRVRRLLRQADVTITNCFWLPVLLGRLGPRQNRLIVSVQRAPKGQMRLYLKSGADLFLAVSSAVRDQIIEQCPEAEPLVHYVNNPINTDIFCDNGRRGDSGTILYAGRIHPEKGIALLLDAFQIVAREHPSARLRLMGAWRSEDGGGGEAFLRELRQKSQGLAVEFCEPVYDRAKYAERLREGAIFCYPSVAEKGESFGVAPLEAMGLGLVPVLSSLACFRDFAVAGGNALQFDHRAPDAAQRLAGSLLSLLKDANLRARLSKAATETAARFTNANIADQYLHEFQSLLGSGRGALVTA